MPHYIWQSNRLAIISAEKAEERKCHLAATKAKKSFLLCLASSLLCSFSPRFTKALDAIQLCKE